ncbi:secretin N-terminal domain-containing protein [uncultured Methylobacterium sp.]|jgi:general secretion pathway protein D|uniref:secretin N-terminal domain-containing protein n=1 Tax=uncultured Methylobacterium sp. TaxID=157278 RepID=UPI002609C534|nr:secretin N-terminal domain-containing protein [uncultured Methylobacterium sp.]
MRDPHRSVASRLGGLRVAGLLLALLAGSGCVSLDGDACADPATPGSGAVLNSRDVAPRNCDGNFLSARRQRSVLYDGEDRPRLWTGDAPRQGVDIDTSRVNAPPAGTPPGAIGYLGTLRIAYAPDADAVAADIAALQNLGSRRFDPDQRVTVDFRKATLDFVLKQLLGGALGLNYVAPDDLGGSVTFRTEQPLPKGQVLQVVRDLLARNGYELRNINGVYHVGRPDLINAIEGTGQAGRDGDRVSRVIRLRRGNARDLLAIARQVLPRGVELVTTNAPDTLILRADPGEADQIETLLKRLSTSGMGEDHVAVVPLRQSAPDKISGQLTEFYRARQADPITIVPLNGQQAVLVSAKDEAMVNGAKQLAQAMDAEVRDEVAPRIIPLKHLSAEELAQRLSIMFGVGGAAPGGGGPAGAGGGGRFGGDYGTDPRSVPPELLRDPAPIPRTIPTATADAGGGPLGGFGNRQAFVPPGADLGGGQGPGPQGQTRIVAEKTSNSLMIYSTYSLFTKVREVVRALDVPPAQVVIEATVVEVELTDRLEQGVQVFLQGRGFTLGSGSSADIGRTAQAVATTDPSGGTGSFFNNGGGTTGGAGQNAITNDTGGILAVGANLGGGLRVDAVLRALQGVTKVKVISSPYLTVLNGKQARLVIGDQIPYSRRSQSANNLGNTTVTEEIEIKDTGIILDITPRIHANNSVALKVNQSVSTPSESVRTGNLTPVIATRTVESDILLQSGRTVLLAGLIQDRLEQQEGGVPVLRTVPVVGDLFKTKVDNVRRVELILMLTPRVTRTPGQIEDVARLLQGQVHAR